jgi:hypothetical protein
MKKASSNMKTGETSVIPMSEAEIETRETHNAEWEANAPRRETMSKISELESLETPRRLAESVLSDEGKTWLTSNREKIATERAKL